MNNRCLEGNMAYCLLYRLPDLWPSWLLEKETACITQHLFLDQNYREVAKRCKHAELKNSFLNLHIIYSPYYSPSVVFCSCCSALGCSMLDGKGSRMLSEQPASARLLE